MKETLKLLLKGSLFGIANIIPGVSGGTMAVVLGIYEYMIEAIGNFFTNKEKRKIYFVFMFKILFGAGITIIVFSWIMDYLLNYYYIYTYLFFIGLIAGSIPAIYKTHPHMKLNIASVITFLIGAGIIVFLTLAFPEVDRTGRSEVEISYNFTQVVKLCFAGFLSGGSMIVPGISGSFMLVLLGQYHVAIRAVKEFDLLPLFFLGIGIAAGIWFFAKIIDILLKTYPKETFYFILGLVIASIYSIYPGLPQTAVQILVSLFILTIAGLFSYWLGQMRNEH